MSLAMNCKTFESCKSCFVGLFIFALSLSLSLSLSLFFLIGGSDMPVFKLREGIGFETYQSSFLKTELPET